MPLNKEAEINTEYACVLQYLAVRISRDWSSSFSACLLVDQIKQCQLLGYLMPKTSLFNSFFVAYACLLYNYLYM